MRPTSARPSEAEAFLTTAGALENTGIGTDPGAARSLLDDAALLTAAPMIHGVEAGHTAYLDIVNGEHPFATAFDAPLSPAEVVEIAGDFVVEAQVAAPAFEATLVADEEAAGDEERTPAS